MVSRKRDNRVEPFATPVLSGERASSVSGVQTPPPPYRDKSVTMGSVMDPISPPSSMIYPPPAHPESPVQVQTSPTLGTADSHTTLGETATPSNTDPAQVCREKGHLREKHKLTMKNVAENFYMYPYYMFCDRRVMCQRCGAEFKINHCSKQLEF